MCLPSLLRPNIVLKEKDVEHYNVKMFEKKKKFKCQNY